MTILSRMAVLSANFIKKRAAPFAKAKMSSFYETHWDTNLLSRPGNWDWLMVKNDFHYWMVVLLTPVAAIITYANVVIGPAKLSVIPEGYEPKEHEYERHPITRWFLKKDYLPSHQKIHEVRLHYVWEDALELRRAQLVKEVKRQMGEHDDYAAWYYQPASGRLARIAHSQHQQVLMEKGVI